jgi:hypothetical protein
LQAHLPLELLAQAQVVITLQAVAVAVLNYNLARAVSVVLAVSVAVEQVEAKPVMDQSLLQVLSIQVAAAAVELVETKQQALQADLVS